MTSPILPIGSAKRPHPFPRFEPTNKHPGDRIVVQPWLPAVVVGEVE